jgi:transcriptional regulator with GAF, ATPase, and Fis domain
MMSTPALAFVQIANECEAEGLTPKNAERIGTDMAKIFGVQTNEVGILRVEKQNLVFCYPVKLHNVGSIPLNTTGSVAARTATSKRAEVINNFAQTKHTSVFEAVELDNKQQQHQIGEKHEHSIHMIQKLMSAPVVTPAGVVGVIQISRKGSSAPASGPDFTAADLQKLVGIAGALAKCFK